MLCTIRERMALPRTLIERLPNLKLITIIGMSLPNLDMAAATEHGVLVAHSSMRRAPTADVGAATPELAWGLVIATRRHLAQQSQRMREGLWQSEVGTILSGRTLGLLGLGRIGKRMAGYGKAFNMEVIAWSQNPHRRGGRRPWASPAWRRTSCSLRSDVLSIHLILGDRSRGLVTARELGLMKPTSYLINTSRGPIVVEADLIEALKAGNIAGAGIDVFDEEPPPADHPFRTLGNVTVTPHLGYVTRETLAVFYGDSLGARHRRSFADGAPTRIANPDALAHAKHHQGYLIADEGSRISTASHR